MARHFILNCDTVELVVRIVTALAQLGLGAAACWGFLLAHEFWTGSIVVADATNRALFTGLMAVYFTMFGLIGFFAEVRGARLQASVLRPFGFLRYWLGRGVFAFICGSMFLFLPWDSRHTEITLAPGAALMAMGICQVLVSMCSGKPDDGGEGAPTRRRRRSGAGGKGGDTEGSKIAWGQPEGSSVAEGADSGDSVDADAVTVVDSGRSGSPRAAFKGGPEAPSPAPDSGILRGASREGSTDGSAHVVIGNPFLNGTAAAR